MSEKTAKNQPSELEQKQTELNQSNMNEHSKTQFENFIYESLKSGGSHSVANKGHGKTRFLFCVAKELMKTENVKVIIFDSSDAWLYGFDKIPVFNISERDIRLNGRKSTEDLEKYSLENENLVKIALDSEKALLFRLKSRNPLKNAFFVRSVVNYLDAIQRAERETNREHTNKLSIAYIIEKSQNVFHTRATSSNEMLTFLSVFNEARNQKEAFFTASQRLNDFSKTIRAKQLLVTGRLSPEDISPFLRKIERKLNIDFSNMKARTWLFNGELILSPEFKQNGKPFIINSEIKQKWLNALPKQKAQSLKEKVLNWLKNKPEEKLPPEQQLKENYRITETEETSNSLFEFEKELDKQEKENEEEDLQAIEEEWIE